VLTDADLRLGTGKEVTMEARNVVADHGSSPDDSADFIPAHDNRFDDDGDHGSMGGVPAGDRAFEVVEIAIAMAVGAGAGLAAGPIGSVVGAAVGAAVGLAAGEASVHMTHGDAGAADGHAAPPIPAPPENGREVL
jgi:hypothetical protein